MQDETGISDPTKKGARSYMTPRTGKGKELCELLRAELGVPEGVTWFEVRFGHDELIQVTCEYIPKA